MTYITRETAGQPGAPLVLTFHGTCGDENQFHDLAERLLSGAHVLSPRGDVAERGMNRYFRRTGEGVYDMDDLAARTVAMAAFVHAAKTRTGARRVVGIGYSNGANILASVAMQAPGLFTEIALMHPLIPWVPDPVPGLSGSRVLITAGRRDPICPAPQTQALIDWFADQRAAVETLWHAGGHELLAEEIDALRGFVG